MLTIYLLTVAISACLLFVVQPLVGRLVLPLYGGAPAVWNTCMLFFQAVLLVGYLYAHLSDRFLSVRGQMFLHMGVVMSAGLLLPIAVPEGWVIHDPNHPAWSLLKLLTISVGGPFFAISANATLLQRWFSTTSHPSAPDPYFLYAISNAGSMIGLLSYPFLIEPKLGLGQQTLVWALGFGVLIIGITACVALTMRDRRHESEPATNPDTSRNVVAGRITWSQRKWSQRAMWVLLAFVPSSWLLSVTTRLTTDIAPIPLFWVVPLEIYLLSFVLVFASRDWFPHRWSKQWMAATAIILVAATVAPKSMWLALLHLLTFFLGAMLCHGELVRRRPDASGLTEFYLWLSVGGVLGGFFNAIVAPSLFAVLLEFGIVVAIACLFTKANGEVPAGEDEAVPETRSMPPPAKTRKPKRRKSVAQVDAAEPSAQHESIIDLQSVIRHWPLVVATLVSVLLLRAVSSDNANNSAWFTLAVVLLIPTLLVLRLMRQTIAFALLVGIALMIHEYDAGPQYNVVYRARSFFGRHLVVDDSVMVGMGQQPRYRRLLHGTTQHGAQSLDPSRKCEPLAYYHPMGPLGDLFSAFLSEPDSRSSDPKQVAAIGLGTGAVACYANPNCEIVFIEVDPIVRDIAQSSAYFTYLSNCGGDYCRVVMADGRQAMEAADDGQYDLVLLDAFSSDAVPTHLMTREAIAMYMKKLGENGVLAFHISNKYLQLDRVLTAAANDLGLACRFKNDAFLSERHREESIRMGKADAPYFVFARDKATLQRLDGSWQIPISDPVFRVWTDDYSNILSVMRVSK
ncbi:MAG: fused MFS/spermidine synthase [Rubripirellula sp.]